MKRETDGIMKQPPQSLFPLIRQRVLVFVSPLSVCVCVCPANDARRGLVVVSIACVDLTASTRQTSPPGRLKYAIDAQF
jgi:hypothetical protein